MKSCSKKELIFEAMRFAAKAHQGQFRRDKKTPYVAHVCGVAMTLSSVFGVQDPEMIAAALLHDTLEDTETRIKDLIKRFGKRVALWVQLLSKDKKLPKVQRERIYRAQLETAPVKVKVVKLADIYDNLTDAKNTSRASLRSFFPKAEAYIRVIAKEKHSSLVKPLSLVSAKMKGKEKFL